MSVSAHYEIYINGNRAYGSVKVPRNEDIHIECHLILDGQRRTRDGYMLGHHHYSASSTHFFVYTNGYFGVPDGLELDVLHDDYVGGFSGTFRINDDYPSESSGDLIQLEPWSEGRLHDGSFNTVGEWDRNYRLQVIAEAPEPIPVAELIKPISASRLPWRNTPLIFNGVEPFINGKTFRLEISERSDFSVKSVDLNFTLSSMNDITECDIYLVNDKLFFFLTDITGRKEWASPGNVYIRATMDGHRSEFSLIFEDDLHDINTTTEFDEYQFYIKEEWHSQLAGQLRQLHEAYGITANIPDVTKDVDPVQALHLTRLRYHLEQVATEPFVNEGFPIELNPVSLWAKNVQIGTYKHPHHWKEVFKYTQSYTAISSALDVIEPNLNAVPAGGLYSDGLQIELQMDKPGIIYYTTDGSEPNSNSSIYSDPIELDSSHMVVKAIGVSDIGFYSNIITESYTAVRPSTLSIEIDDYEITLNWTAVSGAYGYNIYDSDHNKLNTTPVFNTTWSETLDRSIVSKSYYIRVIDVQGRESLPSNIVTAMFAPEDVTNLRISSYTNHSVTLLWDGEDDVIFEIEYGSSMLTTSDKEITISGLTPNTEYTFQVWSKRNDQRSIDAPEITEVTKPTKPGISFTF